MTGKIKTGVVVAIVGTVVFGTAGTASAHTSGFGRTCGEVKLTLAKFAPSPASRPNRVDVFRNGVRIDRVTFTTVGVERSYPEGAAGDVTYRAVWTKTGRDDHSGRFSQVLPLPARCAAAQTTPVPEPEPETAAPSSQQAASPPLPTSDLTTGVAATRDSDGDPVVPLILAVEALVGMLGIGAGWMLVTGRTSGRRRRGRHAAG